MDYWIDGLVRAEPAAPNSSRKKKKLAESGPARQSRNQKFLQKKKQCAESGTA
jgi:hypothetical protein